MTDSVGTPETFGLRCRAVSARLKEIDDYEKSLDTKNGRMI